MIQKNQDSPHFFNENYSPAHSILKSSIRGGINDLKYRVTSPLSMIETDN
jgi:hypothetical protein